jgi:AMP deaminase
MQVTDFIRNKLLNCPDDVVDKDGTTLGQMMHKAGLSAEDINVETLDLHADETLFDRFDRFNAKYNPHGNSQLRTVFLKAENFMGGRYFAEMIKQLMGCVRQRACPCARTGKLG